MDANSEQPSRDELEAATWSITRELNRMPRPKASAQQHRRAYELYNAGFGPTAILQQLYEEYRDDTVSARTIATWIKGYKDLREEVTKLDAPFEWHRLEEYGLPWEASAYLLDMWAHVHQHFDMEWQEFDQVPPPPPTVRQVRWWWRVHQAVPEIENKMDIYWLAESFVGREMYHDIINVPLEMADLEAYLSYKPWSSEERLSAYRRAVIASG